MIVTKISRESRARVVRDGSSHGEGEETSNRPKRRRAAVQRMCDGWREARRSLLLRVADVGFACARLAGSPVGVARPSSSSGARSAGDHLDGARRYASPPGVVVGAQPRPRPPAICSLHQHISLGTGPSNPGLPRRPTTVHTSTRHRLMSLERGRLTRARVRFRWTHPSPHPRAVLSRVRTVPSRP